jgi:hypothetical protein
VQERIVTGMTDEEVVGWFFDNTEQTRKQVAGMSEVTAGIIRDLFITMKARDPEVVEAIRAVYADAEKWQANILEEGP